MSEKLSMYIFEDPPALYRVFDFYKSVEANENFYRNTAYIVRNQLCDWVLPYRGELVSFGRLFSMDLEPGIYKNKKTGKFQYKGPRNKKECERYASSNVVNLSDPKQFSKYQARMFRDMQLEHKASGDIFEPPVHDEDDFTSKAMKTFICSKQVCFSDYGTRLESLAATRGDASMGNARNNAKRALINNNSMSASKAVFYATAFDAEIALIIRDKDDCPNPALKPGEQMIIYANSAPFPIENLVSVQDIQTRLASNKLKNADDSSDGDFDNLFD